MQTVIGGRLRTRNDGVLWVVRRVSRACCVVTALLGLCLFGVAAEGGRQEPIDHDEFVPFAFALFGDPQMGMGPGGLAGSRERFVQAIESTRTNDLELAVIAGDLVHNRNEESYRALEEAWKQFELPVLTVPGNHDIADPATLMRFRERYGRDYGETTWRNCTFLLVDSMLISTNAPWYAPRDDHHAEQVSKQWEWLEKALRRAKSVKRTHTFLVIHVPPFLNNESEEAGYGNLPVDARHRLLELARQFGVRAVLAGHCHSTREIPVSGSDLKIYTAGGTARADAKHGYGYLVFHVEEEGVSREFVQTAPVVPKRKPGVQSSP